MAGSGCHHSKCLSMVGVCEHVVRRLAPCPALLVAECRGDTDAAASMEEKVGSGEKSC